MIIYLFFNLMGSLFTTVITAIASFLTATMPSSITLYWSSVLVLFGGIRALDTILPISELIVLAIAGIALNLTLSLIVNGWGLGRLFLTLIFFWRK